MTTNRSDLFEPGRAAGPAGKGARLLLVEDDATIAAAAYRRLAEEGHVVDIASTATAARSAVDNDDYDLVILDLSLPDGDGIDLLQHWRHAGRGVPIIVVTARSGIEDKVQGLDSGADDYLTKPFEMQELLARVRATLRRRGGPGAQIQILNFANLELDTMRRQLRVAGRRINAPRRELAMLELLLRRAGEVADRNEVLRAAYAEDEHTSSNVLEANVSRQRLAAAGGAVQIESIRGVGYLLRELP